mmetsp:Transcript_20857/g.47043  ORF Transcript_20857/g.47043 Transcript_20857/m.47043 type:complete len:258 (-) Transcript_20857:26-799(-)
MISPCVDFLLDRRQASVLRMTSTSSRPAARIVVPVSTRSTTASANPRPHAASTLPLSSRMSVCFVGSSLAKYSAAIFGKLVAIRFPQSCAFTSVMLLETGAWTESLHFPKPRLTSTLRSSPVSCTWSSPVIPRSTLPSPTNLAMSDAGKKTITMGRFLHTATSTRSGRVYSRPAPFKSCLTCSARRPFFGTAKIAWSSGIVFEPTWGWLAPRVSSIAAMALPFFGSTLVLSSWPFRSSDSANEQQAIMSVPGLPCIF